MGSWKAGLGWALSMYSGAFWQSLLAKCLCFLQGYSGFPLFARQELQGYLWSSVKCPRVSFLLQAIGQANLWESVDLRRRELDSPSQWEQQRMCSQLLNTHTEGMALWPYHKFLNYWFIVTGDCLHTGTYYLSPGWFPLISERYPYLHTTLLSLIHIIHDRINVFEAWY